MAVSYKAVAIANQLLSNLNARGPLTFTMGQASDGYPTLSTGSGSGGAQNIAIKVVNYLSKENAAATTAVAPLPYLDELGLAASPFSPTIIMVTLETSGTANIPLTLAKNYVPVMEEAARFGVDVQLLLTTNGVAPTPGAGTMNSDFNDLYWPGINQN